MSVQGTQSLHLKQEIEIETEAASMLSQKLAEPRIGDVQADGVGVPVVRHIEHTEGNLHGVLANVNVACNAVIERKEWRESASVRRAGVLLGDVERRVWPPRA